MTSAKVPPAKVARAIERVRHHLGRLHQGSVPAPTAMLDLIVGGWISQAITAAADLGVADALADGPLSGAELAARVKADPDALRRVLRALIGRGIFRQRRDGRYELTPLAETLRTDAPVSLARFARFVGAPEHREHWSHLTDAVRTGKAVIPELRGKLLIESVIPEHDRDFIGKWVDIEMLIAAGARERTVAEYGGLLASAGFQMNRVVQTASPISVVEATAT